MNENRTQVDYIVFEGEMARSERHIKRLWIALLIAIAAIIIINLAWLHYISQYDFEDYDYTLSTRGGGNASFVGGDGKVIRRTRTRKDRKAKGKAVRRRKPK